MMDVMKLPVRESLRILVSLESRNGMWSDLLRVVRALMTLPRQEREVLIFLVYSKASPLAPDLHTFSLPAKSMRQSLVVYLSNYR